MHLVSHSGATVGAEAELRLHPPITKTTPQSLRRGISVGRRERIGLGEEELAIVTVHDGLFSGPPPYGDEEDLQNLLVVNEITRRPARYAPARTGFQHLPDLLL